MADDRKKKGGEPALEFFWDSLELAADKTYSTTLRIKLTGWWEGGKPREVSVRVYQKGEEPSSGNSVRIQKGYGIYPLTGFLPGHHYLVDVYIEDRPPVQKVITVPELPKPKTPEQEALELERTQLERTRVYSERKKLAAQEKKPTRDEKKLASLQTQTELVKAEKKLQAEKKEPSPDQRAADELNARTVRVNTEKQLVEAEQALKKVQPPESKRQVKILNRRKEPSRLVVLLQRIGRDGKPEKGDVSIMDFRQGGIVFDDAGDSNSNSRIDN